MIKVNHKKAGNFDALPEGVYEVIIEAGQYKSASTGADMINWKFKVRDDVEAQSQFKGRFLFSNLVFTDTTEGIVQSFLKAIGTKDGQDFNSFDELIKFATGRAVSLKVTIEQYKGDDKNVVKSVNAPKVAGGKIDSPFGDGEVATGDPLDNGGEHTRVDNDPFATSNGPIEVNDDDLPF